MKCTDLKCEWMGFDKTPYNHHPNRDIDHFHHPENSLMTLPDQFHSLEVGTVLTSNTVDEFLPVLELHAHAVSVCAFGACFLSLCMIFLSLMLLAG